MDISCSFEGAATVDLHCSVGKGERASSPKCLHETFLNVIDCHHSHDIFHLNSGSHQILCLSVAFSLFISLPFL